MRLQQHRPTHPRPGPTSYTPRATPSNQVQPAPDQAEIFQRHRAGRISDSPKRSGKNFWNGRWWSFSWLSSSHGSWRYSTFQICFQSRDRLLRVVSLYICLSGLQSGVSWYASILFHPAFCQKSFSLSDCSHCTIAVKRLTTLFCYSIFLITCSSPWACLSQFRTRTTLKVKNKYAQACLIVRRNHVCRGLDFGANGLGYHYVLVLIVW